MSKEKTQMPLGLKITIAVTTALGCAEIGVLLSDYGLYVFMAQAAAGILYLRYKKFQLNEEEHEREKRNISYNQQFEERLKDAHFWRRGW